MDYSTDNREAIRELLSDCLQGINSNSQTLYDHADDIKTSLDRVSSGFTYHTCTIERMESVLEKIDNVTTPRLQEYSHGLERMWVIEQRLEALKSQTEEWQEINRVNTASLELVRKISERQEYLEIKMDDQKVTADKRSDRIEQLLANIVKNQHTAADNLLSLKISQCEKEAIDNSSIADLQFNLKQIANTVTKDDLEEIRETISAIASNDNDVKGAVEKLAEQSTLQQNEVFGLKNVVKTTESEINKISMIVNGIKNNMPDINKSTTSFEDIIKTNISKLSKDIEDAREENSKLIDTKIYKSFHEQFAKIREKFREMEKHLARIDSAQDHSISRQSSGWKSPEKEFSIIGPVAGEPKKRKLCNRTLNRRSSSPHRTENSETNDAGDEVMIKVSKLESLCCTMDARIIKLNNTTDSTSTDIKKTVEIVQSDIRRLIRDKLINGQLAKVPEVSSKLELMSTEIEGINKLLGINEQGINKLLVCNASDLLTINERLIRMEAKLLAKQTEPKQPDTTDISQVRKLVEPENEIGADKFMSTFQPVMNFISKHIKETCEVRLKQEFSQIIEAVKKTHSFGQYDHQFIGIRGLLQDKFLQLHGMVNKINNRVELLSQAGDMLNTSSFSEIKELIDTENKQLTSLIFNALRHGYVSDDNKRPQRQLVDLTRSHGISNTQQQADDNAPRWYNKNDESDKRPNNPEDKLARIDYNNVTCELREIAKDFINGKFSFKEELEKLCKFEHDRHDEMKRIFVDWDSKQVVHNGLIKASIKDIDKLSKTIQNMESRCNRVGGPLPPEISNPMAGSGRPMTPPPRPDIDMDSDDGTAMSVAESVQPTMEPISDDDEPRNTSTAQLLEKIKNSGFCSNLPITIPDDEDKSQLMGLCRTPWQPRRTTRQQKNAKEEPQRSTRKKVFDYSKK